MFNHTVDVTRVATDLESKKKYARLNPMILVAMELDTTEKETINLVKQEVNSYLDMDCDMLYCKCLSMFEEPILSPNIQTATTIQNQMPPQSPSPVLNQGNEQNNPKWFPSSQIQENKQNQRPILGQTRGNEQNQTSPLDPTQGKQNQGHPLDQSRGLNQHKRLPLSQIRFNEQCTVPMGPNTNNKHQRSPPVPPPLRINQGNQGINPNYQRPLPGPPPLGTI